MTDSRDRSGAETVWQRDEIQSPCVQVCVIHPEARICIGCHRTGDEIARWSRMTADERRDLMAELPGREGQLARRRGGRGRNSRQG
ncbi:MAG: DUF1289 domain-containing protein [Pseudomonadota bacterium]